VSVLEQALVDLGRHLRYPESDGVVDDVLGRLRARERPELARRMTVLVAATLTLLTGLAVLSPAVRAAFLRIFALPGIRIEVVEEAPPAPVRTLGEGLSLGERVSLDEAEGTVGFLVRLPADLGVPDQVFVERFLPGGRVWLVYRAGPGLPKAAETGVGLLVAEFRGSLDEPLLKKVTDEGGTVTPVRVDGNEGFFVPGAHTVYVLDENGNPVGDEPRLAGNVLVWEVDGVTYRIESALGLTDSLGLAESFT
jgi:hypothetical protein